MPQRRRAQRWLPLALAVALVATAGIAYAADLAFLGKTEKAADSDKLDGLDSTAFLGAEHGRLDTELMRIANLDARTFGFPTGDPQTGNMEFEFACRTDGTSSLTARSGRRFVWWWDDSFGITLEPGGPPHVEVFAIGNGTERHSFRGALEFTIVLEIDTNVTGNECFVGYTVLEHENEFRNVPD